LFLPRGLRIAGTITPDFRNSNNCPRGFLVNSVFGAESGSGANSEGPRVQLSFICDVSGQVAGSARAVRGGGSDDAAGLGRAPERRRRNHAVNGGSDDAAGLGRAPERRRRNHAVNGGSAVATPVALRLRESMNVRPQINMQFEISDSSAICRPFVRAKMHSQLTRRVMIEGSRRAQLAASN
jgi:hypothetical protein